MLVIALMVGVLAAINIGLTESNPDSSVNKANISS